MSHQMSSITATSLLEQLVSSGKVGVGELPKLSESIKEDQQDGELPLYLRILVGIGAAISSFCFIGFLSVAKIVSFSSEGDLIGVGFMLIAAALAVALLAREKEHNLKHSFLMQSSFCLMGMGKILFTMGVAMLFKPDEMRGALVATLLLTVGTYHVYRMSIDRFLSSSAVALTLFLNVMFEKELGLMHGNVVNLILILMLVFAGFLFTNPRVKRAYLPLAYALSTSLSLIVLFLPFYFSSVHTVSRELQRSIGAGGFSLMPLTVALCLGLVFLMAHVGGGWKRLLQQPLSIAVVGVILLGTVSAPGILLALALMILGYGRHERLLWTLGLLLMPAFIWFYYYTLELTLLEKSGVLVGSGCVLLLGRLYLTVRGYAEEPVS